MGPERRAAQLPLHMSDVARKVFSSVGEDVIGNLGGAEQILKILQGGFAPDAIGSIPQDVAKFMYFKRTDQNADTYIMEFEMLRRKAEARMVMGFGYRDEFAAVLCMQHAGQTKDEKIMALARFGNTLASPQAPPHVRRPFGPCGYATRQDVVGPQGMGAASEKEDFEAWAAYRKAKRVKKEGGGQGKRDKTSGRERTENPMNRRTGQRDRFHKCNSEYHYAPQCPQKENRYSGAPSPVRNSKEPPNKPYPSIAMEVPNGRWKSAEAGPLWAGAQAGTILLHHDGIGGGILGVPIGRRGGPGRWSYGESGSPQMAREPKCNFGETGIGESSSIFLLCEI